jgi:hypothetical protein
VAVINDLIAKTEPLVMIKLPLVGHATFDSAAQNGQLAGFRRFL